MPNEKEKNKYYLKVPKRNQKTQRSELKNHPRSMFFNHHSEHRVQGETKQIKV